ncbi:MAG: murein biosynthesis integral membrane protein MurJ [Gammaproteobacteria bacterium]
MSKNLLKSTSVVSAMTLLSRVMGFVRDTLVAQFYGVNASVDAFNVAWKIPNFMRNLFAEGSFSQAFVPILSEYKQTRSPEEVRKFTSYIMGAMILFLFCITLVGLFASPWLIKLFAPGFAKNSPRFEMATAMLQITFPYLMLISLTAVSSALLNTYGRFSIPAFTPVLLNISLIVAAIWLSPYLNIPVEAQAWGVLIAGFIQLAFQLPFLYRLGFLVHPKLNWHDPGVRRVMLLMLPALFGASIGQISLLINTIFASFLTVGSITWLYFSERLAYFPLGVFGVALATVVLPHLSAKHAEKSKEAFAKTLDWGIRCNLLIGIPAVVTLLILSGPFIVTLFYYKKFTVYDVMMTQQSVLAYSVGLLAFMLVKVLSAGFFARQDIRTPVKIGIYAVIVNMILNALLVFPLKHAGLALAASLSSWFNVGLLLFFLYRKKIYRFQTGWGLFLLRLILANTAIGMFLFWMAGDLQKWFDWSWQQRLSQVCFLGISAMVIYVGTLWISGFRWKDLRI